MLNKSGIQQVDKDYRDLWRSVILQAIKDITDSNTPVKHQDSAHRFLSGHTGALQDICEFIGEEYCKVVDWYHSLGWLN